MGVKLRMTWENVQGDDCRVDFDYVDYIDEPQVIYGGPRPFVLSEYNSDDDIFKPIRPMIATIEILASAAGVKMEDFLADNDTDITVKFYLGSWNYWNGYLSQEDIEETWIATNHILTLRAYEGIGTLSQLSIVDENGDSLDGMYTPLQLINYSIAGAYGSLLGARFICNLYHTSMSSASSQMGLDQCKIDARTFENAPGDFEDCLSILSKINLSWNMTMFQWQGQWNFVRIPEYFTSGNQIGFLNNALGRIYQERRYDIEVGANESVKPIMPEMLKRVNKSSKTTEVRHDWVLFSQVLCNESFEAGEFIGTTTESGVIKDRYSVQDWEHRKGTTSNNQASVMSFVRITEFADNFEDTYIKIEVEPGSTNSWVQSCQVQVFSNEVIEISYQQRWEQIQSGQAGQEEATALVLLYADDGTWYSLTEDGDWLSSNPTTDNVAFIGRIATAQDADEWASIEVKSDKTPKKGYIIVFLYVQNSFGNLSKYFKDLNFDIFPSINTRRTRKIKGDYDRYTISRSVSKSFVTNTYLDDGFYNYKGSIYEMDGLTLTGDEWYRRKTFNDTSATSERLTFKRHSALAHWFINRDYKAKIDANFFGLKWNAGGFDQPIGLINTIKFVDDAPTKIYWIANLRDIDFMACTWSATLFEVYDTDVDDNEPTDLDVHSFDFYYE